MLDVASRRAKGLKIERLLGLTAAGGPYRLLEVGTGAGGIAHYFATHPTLECSVDAVDVNDNRQVHDGYRFQRVDDVVLPYADGAFDVVISNHVIEHVGDRGQQQRHVRELARVLAPGGRGYLAVPNRWMLVEPHYHLAFLSWLPHRLRSPYLRSRGRGEHYDCEPLQLGQLEALLRGAGLEFTNLGAPAVRTLFEIERPAAALTAVVRRIPDAALWPLRRITPTLVYGFSR
jgi:SAM-dependent methyltransferase